MNETCYTKFPEEDEILLDDGRPFLVEQIFKDQVVEDGPYQGEQLTHIYFKSNLPQGIKPEKTGKLCSQGTLREFTKNGCTCPSTDEK